MDHDDEPEPFVVELTHTPTLQVRVFTIATDREEGDTDGPVIKRR
jgi:hypothetical protein